MYQSHLMLVGAACPCGASQQPSAAPAISQTRAKQEAIRAAATVRSGLSIVIHSSAYVHMHALAYEIRHHHAGCMYHRPIGTDGDVGSW